MVTCEVCGSENFDNYDGFLYCSVCLTQSQDYYEQEYDYHHHEISTSRSLKKRSTPTKSVSEAPEDGSWTSWEAFNYILNGMTQDIKKCGVEDDFEVTVLKIWAAYLKTCDIAFTSKNPERLPKLGLPFKTRDARILYKADVPINFSVKKKRKSSRTTDVSNSSLLSKRSYIIRKSKMIAADYQEHLSNSMSARDTLADETLESLKITSTEGESSEENINDIKSVIKSFGQMMRKKDYKKYRNSYKSSVLLANAKSSAETKIQYLGKNKLLSVIHLALLVTRSKIQLSDLLRFIREGHLSFAKVTHFFPSNIKFPKKDSVYIDVISDSYMPTHLRQRKITGQLGCILNMEKIPVPNIVLLVERYCNDLNLPDEISRLSEKIASNFWPTTEVPRSKTPLSSFEAWAMASIIFIIKLMFGMNDRTEIFFSRLAAVANRINEGEIFDFENWQKYIECRKSILMNYHYPTQEQLNDSSYTNSKMFLEMLVKESKDENRSKRFIPYSNYYMSESLVSGIKDKLEKISSPQNLNLIDFKSSLTPATSHLDTILNKFETSHKFPIDLLNRKFKNCDVKPFLQSEKFLSNLKEKHFDLDNILEKNGFHKEDIEYLMNCSSNYWILEYPTIESGNLINFKQEILEKTPRNFQWLLGECARMLEMNMRDIYDELLRLEKNLQPGAKRKRKKTSE